MDHHNSRMAYQLILEECSVQGAGLLLTSLNDTEFLKADERKRL